MPTSYPPLYKCNTNAPGWLKGEHPSVADGQVTRKACFHWSNCCSLSTNIKVRNCGSYYVYYLKSTGSCWYRYCSTDWTDKSSLLTNLIVRQHIVTTFDWKKALSQIQSNNDCILSWLWKESISEISTDRDNRGWNVKIKKWIIYCSQSKRFR